LLVSLLNIVKIKTTGNVPARLNGDFGEKGMNDKTDFNKK
jgi:hypothetical protein